MTNIFQLSAELGAEDRFTASLHYLLDNFPQLGQQLADLLLSSAGKPTSRFLAVHDHPQFTREDQPDFEIVCEDCHILCEHKLDSDLGSRQLQRYLNLRREKPTYLALITNRLHQLEQDVLEHAAYLVPRQKSTPYFSWEQFYPLVEARSERLCRDFANYMGALGMKPWRPVAWTDLFDDATVAVAFGEQWREAQGYFTSQGGVCRLDADKRGLQVSRPRSWLPLFYLHVSRTLEPPTTDMHGPFLAARAYVVDDPQIVAQFERAEAPAEFLGVSLFSRPLNRRAAWNSSYRLVREFYVSLDSVISPEAQILRANLCEFARRTFETTIAVMAQSAPIGPGDLPATTS